MKKDEKILLTIGVNKSKRISQVLGLMEKKTSQTVHGSQTQIFGDSMRTYISDTTFETSQFKLRRFDSA